MNVKMNKFYIFHLTVNENVYMPNDGEDCYHGFVIISTDEKSARMLAQINGGDEVEDESSNERYSNPFWIDKSKTDCLLFGISIIQKGMIIESSFNS
jgi:hypothetical protein